jgi:hypothetical protein
MSAFHGLFSQVVLAKVMMLGNPWLSVGSAKDTHLAHETLLGYNVTLASCCISKVRS